MKKTNRVLFSAVLALALTLAMAVCALAETVPAEKEWTVSFTNNNKMESDFKTSQMDDQISGLQPGDSTDIVLNLQNNNTQSVDWYMTNKVIQSLEDTRDQVSGGAYTYILTFTNSSTGEEKVLFSSDTVGGEDVSTAGAGLHEATDALSEDWLFLDTFANGEGGVITLHVALDGETQGNSYQDTLAELSMNFAVEPVPLEGGSTTTTTTTNENKVIKKTITENRSVRTGDETNMIPYFIAAAVSGLVVLFLAIYSLRERSRQRGGRA